MPDKNTERSVGNQQSSRSPWRSAVSGSTATSELTAPTTSATKPSSNIDTLDFPSATFLFAGTDAAEEIVNYQIIGWSKFAEGPAIFWMPVVLAKGSYTLGSMTAGAAGAIIEGSGTLFADEIREDVQRAGTVIRRASAGNAATLTVDAENHQFLEVQTDRDTAATATVLVRLSERATGFVKEPSQDMIDFATITVTQAHHEIHEGNSYYVYKSAIIGDGVTIDIALTTPDTMIRAHATIDWSASLGAALTITEDASRTGGDSFTPLNRDRNSAKTSTLTALTDTTGGGAGDFIDLAIVGEKKTGFATRGTSELVLKHDSQYRALLTSSQADNATAIKISWYETATKGA